MGCRFDSPSGTLAYQTKLEPLTDSILEVILFKPLFALFISTMLVSTASSTNCSGIIPENNLQRPATTRSLTGLSQSQYNSSISRLNRVYTPIFKASGYRLNIISLWNDPTVNAYAYSYAYSPIKSVKLYGGFARYPGVDSDTYNLVICHELGHHLGGRPGYGGGTTPPFIGAEGQADYYATLKCFRQIYTEQENSTWVKTQKSFDAQMLAKCTKQYPTGPKLNLCLRSGTAGLNLGNIMQKMFIEQIASLGYVIKPLPLSHATPDLTTVSFTVEDDYPSLQCRVDTFLEGALCRRDVTDLTTTTSIHDGTCTTGLGNKVGRRPACWFIEKDFSQDKLPR